MGLNTIFSVIFDHSVKFDYHGFWDFYGETRLQPHEVQFLQLILDYIKERGYSSYPNAEWYEEFLESRHDLYTTETIEIFDYFKNNCIIKEFSKYKRYELFASWIKGFWDCGYNILEHLYDWLHFTTFYISYDVITESVEEVEKDPKYSGKSLLEEWKHLMSIKTPSENDLRKEEIVGTIKRIWEKQEKKQYFDYKEVVSNIIWRLSVGNHPSDEYYGGCKCGIKVSPFEVIYHAKDHFKIGKILDVHLTEKFGNYRQCNDKLFWNFDLSEVLYKNSFKSSDYNVIVEVQYQPYSDDNEDKTELMIMNQKTGFKIWLPINFFFHSIWDKELSTKEVWEHFQSFAKKIVNSGIRCFFEFRKIEEKEDNKRYLYDEEIISLELLYFWLHNYPELIEEYFELAQAEYPNKDNQTLVEDLWKYICFHCETMEIPHPQSVWSYFENFGEYPLAFFDTLPEMLPFIFNHYPSAKLFEPWYTWELLYNKEYNNIFLNMVKNQPDWNVVAKKIYQEITKDDDWKEYYPENFIRELENAKNEN